jgi:hypothetical protein
MITAESKIPVDLSSASSVFFGLPMNTCVLRIPFGALAAYKAAVKWQDFINIVEIGPVALLATFSNTTLSHINSPIACNSLPKATIYQWLFVTATETVRATSADTIFIPGKAGLKFGTAYTVSIRAMVGDLWSAFGEAYTIRMPAAPSTNLAASYRSATMKDWNSLFRAHYMGGATRYEFVFTDKTTGQVLTYLSKNHAMCFRSLAGAQAGHTYLLKIRPWYGMSEGTFGTSFSITAPK